jgi:hypothetical protein
LGPIIQNSEEDEAIEKTFDKILRNENQEVTVLKDFFGEKQVL